VNRFFLSPDAKRDLAEIKLYLDGIAKEHALKIARSLQQTLRSLGENAYQGVGQSELSRMAGAEVRSRLVREYRVIYILGGSAPEVIGVLHTARDIAEIMAGRLQ